MVQKLVGACKYTLVCLAYGAYAALPKHECATPVSGPLQANAAKALAMDRQRAEEKRKEAKDAAGNLSAEPRRVRPALAMTRCPAPTHRNLPFWTSTWWAESGRPWK